MHAQPRAALAKAAALASFITLSTVATPALAAFQLSNVGLQCSDSLVVQEGDAYVLSCTGDLSLQGLGGQGSFLADTSITLNATGSLSLLDVVLRAPTIALYGEVDVKVLGRQTGLVGTDVTVSSAGTVEVGGFIDIRGNGNTPVPPGRVGGSTGGAGPSGGVIAVSGAGDIDLRPGAGAILPGSGDRDPPQGGQLVITNGGSLGSNDPKFGDVTLPTVGSAVPEASGWATMAIGLIALTGLVRRPRH